MKFNVTSPIDYQAVGDDGKAKGKPKRYEPGDTIDLDEDAAKPLLEAKAIETPSVAKAAEEKAKK